MISWCSHYFKLCKAVQNAIPCRKEAQITAPMSRQQRQSKRLQPCSYSKRLQPWQLEQATAALQLYHYIAALQAATALQLEQEAAALKASKEGANQGATTDSHGPWHSARSNAAVC